ncbi:MAG: NAD-dependent epimerase/dehydratase family protein [Verrucomicrobia bacterium]|nr:NAD-dependent epimerase/dehydratase family protein [Verrucomicrobiota bacterium]
MEHPLTTCLVTGAAGFIGSHLVDHLLALGHRVVGIDNLLLGKRTNLAQALRRPDFIFLEQDVNDFDGCRQKLRELVTDKPIDTVWHLAANSDIRAGTADPEVDLRHTFLTTFNVLKLMQPFGCRKLAFASSSAIYGPHPGDLTEDAGPLQPISNYGAMKLASEGVISAALETFLERAWIFRFPNVVGSRATHGVIYDFLKKLQTNAGELEVLGDGRQEKPYLHVSELIEAMIFIVQNVKEKLNPFNIGADGSATTVRYIAEAVLRATLPHARIRYTGGAQGWPGDVPKFSYSIEKLRRLGWTPKLTSDQAVDRAIAELVKEVA